MAEQKIIRDEDTGEVTLVRSVVRSVTVEVRREKGGDFFLCSIGGQLRERHKDINVVTKAIKNQALRRQIIAIFMAKGDSLEQLIQERFSQYTISPYPKKGERRSAHRPRHRSGGNFVNLSR